LWGYVAGFLSDILGRQAGEPSRLGEQAAAVDGLLEQKVPEHFGRTG